MNPADSTPADLVKTFTDFWTSQGQVMLKAQEQATRTMTETMQAMASGVMPGPLGGNVGDLSSGAAELARVSQSMMDVWSAANAMSGELAGKIGTPQTGRGDETVAAVFARIADPRQWMAGTGEMDDVLGRMAEGPRLADLGEIERRYARVTQAWFSVRRSGMEHNAVVLQAWLQAARHFMQQSPGLAGTDAKAPDPKVTMKLWTEVANRQLLETQRSEPFLKTQRDMIRASTELRMAQQELVEHFGKQYGFPTRTELDDVHRTVTELRRELRAMRRAMVAQTQAQTLAQTQAQTLAQTQAPTPEPADQPVRAIAARHAESRKSGKRKKGSR